MIPVMEAGLEDLVAMDHRLTAEVCLMPAPGHTPGMVCVDIQSPDADGRTRRAILVGDLLQVKHPHWSTRFCADAEQSRRTRTEFLARFADSGVLALPAHFLAPTAGRIERDGAGYRFVHLDPA